MSTFNKSKFSTNKSKPFSVIKTDIGKPVKTTMPKLSQETPQMPKNNQQVSEFNGSDADTKTYNSLKQNLAYKKFDQNSV